MAGKPIFAALALVALIPMTAFSAPFLQICGGCHDQANDPEFEFAVKDKIERQRHGTIEASATRAGKSAAQGPATAPLLGALERGFAILDEQG